MILGTQTLPALPAVCLLVVAASSGAYAGSFVNTVAWRTARGKSVFLRRSSCPSCGHQLRTGDLVPVLSWVFLRGRCRFCVSKISGRYVLTELLLSFLFVLIVLRWGLSVQAIAYCLLSTVLLGLTLVDIETQKIPNGFILAGLIVWLTSVWFMSVPPDAFATGSIFAGALGTGFLPVLLDGLLGAFGVGGGILVFSLLFEKMTGRNSLGGGDIKLFFMVGLFLGFAGSVVNLLLACALGLLFALIWNFFKPKFLQIDYNFDPAEAGSISSQPYATQSTKAKTFPFGPAIAASTMLTLFIGPLLLGWYFGLA